MLLASSFLVYEKLPSTNWMFSKASKLENHHCYFVTIKRRGQLFDKGSKPIKHNEVIGVKWII